MRGVRAAALGLACSLLVHPVSAQDRAAAGTVLIRVMAKASAAIIDETGATHREEELPDAVVATGSGLVVSRLGYVVTNHHVVADEEYRGRIRGVLARITLTVQRVEVLFPPDSSSSTAGTALEASVVASDPELDLAVLAVPGNDLPYVPLGDSDILRSGQPVSVIGYPLGEALDVGRDTGDDEALVPAMASGVVSALRPDAQGVVRYIQTSAPLNRGNSGGPLLDRNGFAVGVVQMKARAAEGIGFAIPINLVKDFLERNGLDTALPATRLTLGHLYDSSDKLIRIQAPAGFEDTAASRLMVDSGASLPGVALHLDRIASTWGLEQIEEELRSGRDFEAHESIRGESSVRDGRVLRGQASGSADGRPLRMIYALMDQRGEKIVARYVGTPEQVGYNASVLAASLASLEAAPMLSVAGRPRADATLVRVSAGVLVDVVTAIPAGWVIDAGGPIPCAGLEAARESLLASPRQDFTISFRVGRRDTVTDSKRAAARCAGEGGSATESAYKRRFSKFGIEYIVEGWFVPSGSGTVQVEVVAPTRTFPAAREAFARWAAELGLGEKSEK